MLSACSEAPQTSNAVEEIEVSEPVVLTPVDISTLIEELGQDTEFDIFKDKFLSRNWELFPSRAVYQGYYKHDDKLLVPNGELRALRRAFFVNELQAIKSFDANQLSSSNATDLAIIEGHLKSSLWYIDSFRSYEWNPAQYNPAGTFGLILNTDYKPYPQRIEVISRRLMSVPEFYQAAKNNLKMPTLEHLSLAIQQSAGALKMFSQLIPESIEAQKKDGFVIEEQQRKEES